MEEIKNIISQMTEIELYGNKNLVVYFNLVYNKDNDKNIITQTGADVKQIWGIRNLV